MKIEIDMPSGDARSGYEIQWRVRDPRSGAILRDRIHEKRLPSELDAQNTARSEAEHWVTTYISR